MTYLERIRKAELDKEYAEHTVKTVTVHETGFEVEVEDGWSIYIVNELECQAPNPGDVLRLYGRGLGYPIRGVGLKSPLWPILKGLYRYQTPEEFKLANAVAAAEAKLKKQEEWANKSAENVAKIKAFPKPFQDRIEFFMRNPSWGPEFGPYELFCCEEAVKLVKVCPTHDQIKVYAEAKYDEQKVLAPELDLENHSGNTHGCMMSLANCYVTSPELLPQMHGALCPLVGCKNYGCYASTLKGFDEKA